MGSAQEHSIAKAFSAVTLYFYKVLFSSSSVFAISKANLVWLFIAAPLIGSDYILYEYRFSIPTFLRAEYQSKKRSFPQKLSFLSCRQQDGYTVLLGILSGSGSKVRLCYPLTAMCMHSCVTNTDRVILGPDKNFALLLTASKTIKSGDVITINYSELFTPTIIRDHSRASTIYFWVFETIHFGWLVLNQ